MSVIIGFKSDEQMKLMAGALASRLGYQDVSALMRAILEEKIAETFSEKERDQLTALLSPKTQDTARDEALPKGKTARRG